MSGEILSSFLFFVCRFLLDHGADPDSDTLRMAVGNADTDMVRLAATLFFVEHLAKG